MLPFPIILAQPDRLIRPGVGIGAARLGHSDDWNWHQFPGKTAGDGATWAGEHAFAGKKTITLAGPLVKGHIVTVISTDSPRFRLANELHVGSSARRIEIAFPGARSVETDGPRVRWDDVRRGLGWWMSGGRVFEIEVHRPGKPVDKRDTYLSTIAP